MKILLIARIWGEGGGVETYLIGLVKSLIRRGHKITILYAGKGAVPMKEKLYVNAEYFMPGLNEYPKGDRCKEIEQVKEIIRNEEIDIVYVDEIRNYIFLEDLVSHICVVTMLHGCMITCIRHGTKTFYLSKQICKYKLGINCFLHGCFMNHPLEWGQRPIFSNMAKARRRMQAYRKIETVLVASHYMKKELLNNGFKDQQIAVLPYSVNRIPELAEIDLTYTNNTVLFVGRIDRYKGVDILLKALSLIGCKYKCVIVGDGPYLKRCKRLCRSLHLENNVEFPGWVYNDDLFKIYSQASVVVVPSIWPEPFGIVGIEAMSFARPVVAFNVGGIPEWLEHGKTGFLVERLDYQDMADKITRLLSNDSLSREMGINGYNECLKRFNQKDYIEQLEKIFVSAVSNSRRYVQSLGRS